MEIDDTIVARAAGDSRRQLLFLELLPKHNWKIKSAAIEAGYTEKTADRQGKRILRTALATSLKLQTKALEAKRDAKGKEEVIFPTSKELVIDMKDPNGVLSLIGYSSVDVISHYKFVVEQEKDMNAKLKALSPLLKLLGINLQDEPGNKTIIPQLFIGMEAPEKQEDNSAFTGLEMENISTLPGLEEETIAEPEAKQDNTTIPPSISP